MPLRGRRVDASRFDTRKNEPILLNKPNKTESLRYVDGRSQGGESLDYIRTVNTTIKRECAEPHRCIAGVNIDSAPDASSLWQF